MRTGVKLVTTLSSGGGVDFILDAEVQTYAALRAANGNDLTGKRVRLIGDFREHIQPDPGMTFTGQGARVLGSTALTGWNRTSIAGIAADIGDEGFENAAGNGCDAANWQAATLGAGSSVDTNYTTGPIAGVQSARFVKASTNCQLNNFLSAGQAILYAVATVKFESYSLPSNGNVIDIFQIGDGSIISARVGLQNISGQVRFRSTVFNNNATAANTNGTPVVANTTDTFKFYLKYDKTNALAEVKIENVTTGVTTTMYSAALTGTVAGNSTRLRIGDATNALAATWLTDTVRWGTLGYPADAIAAPANCWWIDDVSAVKQIWAIGATTAWSVERASSAAATVEHDWFRTNGKIAYYTGGETAGFNPTSRYTAVEGAVRAHCIAKAGVDNVAISGIECAYSWHMGISGKTVSNFGTFDATKGGDNWIVQANTCHHIGYKGTTAYSTFTCWGDGITIGGSDWSVSGNTVYDCGRHGIAFSAVSPLDVVADSVARANTIFDCYHTLVDLQASSGAAQSGSQVLDNLLYLTSAYEEARSNDMIFVQDQVAGSNITGVVVQGNKLKNIRESGIHVGPNASASVKANSIGATWSGFSGTMRGIFIEGAALTGNRVEQNVVEVDGNTTSFRALDIDDTAKLDAVNYNLFHATGASGLIAQVGASNYTNAQWATYKSDTGFDVNGVAPADPLFDANLALLAGSPAIGAGPSGINLGA